MNKITKILTKPQTQVMIKALRDAGYTVDKLDAGYSCKVNGIEIFRAMNGTRGYLVRYAEQLFTKG